MGRNYTMIIQERQEQPTKMCERCIEKDDSKPKGPKTRPKARPVCQRAPAHDAQLLQASAVHGGRTTILLKDVWFVRGLAERRCHVDVEPKLSSQILEACHERMRRVEERKGSKKTSGKDKKKTCLFWGSEVPQALKLLCGPFWDDYICIYKYVLLLLQYAGRKMENHGALQSTPRLLVLKDSTAGTRL